MNIPKKLAANVGRFSEETSPIKKKEGGNSLIAHPIEPFNLQLRSPTDRLALVPGRDLLHVSLPPRRLRLHAHRKVSETYDSAEWLRKSLTSHTGNTIMGPGEGANFYIPFSVKLYREPHSTNGRVQRPK